MAVVTIRRGTTPTIRVKQSTDIDFSDIATLRLTLEQGDIELTKEVERADFTAATYHDFHYTQDETLEFAVGGGKIQCKAKLNDQNVVGGEVGSFKVTEILDEDKFEVV